MKLIKNLLILSTLAATSAFAASAGFYAGATAGYGSINFKSYTYPGHDGATVSASKKTGLAYGVQLGYNFNQYIGIEAAYNKLPKLTLKTSGVKKTQSSKMSDYSLSVVGYYPLNDQFDLVGKAGYASVKASGDGDSNSKGTPVFAVGAQYVLQQNMYLQATYSYFLKKNSFPKDGDNYRPNINLFAVSFNYNFSSMM